MQVSKRRIPHFAYVAEVDVTEVEALRAHLNATRRNEQPKLTLLPFLMRALVRMIAEFPQVNARFDDEAGVVHRSNAVHIGIATQTANGLLVPVVRHADARGKLTLLPLLMRALVLAVREFPLVNARFDDEAGVVTRHAAVHLGIATQTDNGLMVPVVRHAEARDLWSSAREVARLAEAARSGSATRDELTGSTITITSLGALGGIVSTPVINHPEVAIVGVNRIVERPFFARGGGIVARQTMNLSSSFDHRVVDGVDAARFIQALRGYLESPALLFVE
jgi:pyruvate/2-oxoglutarate dehydrogenase complex dihydrolipoamide acyltransferase (E2) component